MSSCVLIPLLTFALALAEREELQSVCAGKEFRLPVYSTSRTVTFTPNSEGTKRILLENTTIKDPRFEWTRDKMLVLKEVTHSDQGLYAIKLFSGFTYETVRLMVSECIKSYRRLYGESFEHNISENALLLEFSPKGASAETMPIVLWNRTNPQTTVVERGWMRRNGKVWVAERVTQLDQGRYTVRDALGKVLSHSTLTVREHSFNVTRFTKESLNLPLFLTFPHVHLLFNPTWHPDESPGPVRLIREGLITDYDLRYKGLISFSRNGGTYEVVIARLTSKHEGVYEIRDDEGNLVSSTVLHVIERGFRWHTLLKSITAPSGIFLSLAGVILFIKRYPKCSLSQIIPCLRANRTPPANPPRANIQGYSQSSPCHLQQPIAPRDKTPRASPSHTGYMPVKVVTPRAENQRTHRLAAGSSLRQNSTNVQNASNEEENISFSVPGAKDCLNSSEDTFQFQIKKDAKKEKWNKSQEYIPTLPLDTDTSESCSIYTSEKLNFL